MGMSTYLICFFFYCSTYTKQVSRNSLSEVTAKRPNIAIISPTAGGNDLDHNIYVFSILARCREFQG